MTIDLVEMETKLSKVDRLIAELAKITRGLAEAPKNASSFPYTHDASVIAMQASNLLLDCRIAIDEARLDDIRRNGT